jgi:hypothetical protein
LRVPGGMVAGALLGNKFSGAAGKVISHIPGVGALVTGPAEDIISRVVAGLASPAEYERLLAARATAGPSISHPGAISRAATAAGRAAIGPTTNPQTGLPQFNLQDAQAAQRPFAALARGLDDGSMRDRGAVRAHLETNKQAIRGAHGGQALPNAMRVHAVLTRPETVAAHLASGALNKALANTGVQDRRHLIQMALENPALTKVLAESVSAHGLSKPQRARLLAAVKAAAA